MIRIRKAGAIYILLTILIGFAAVNTGNNLVYIVTSALLSIMLISGIFGRRNIQGLKPDLAFPEEIYAGSDVPVEIRLRNTRRFMPAFLIRVAVDGQEAFFPFVSARSSASLHLSMRFETRGSHRTGGFTLSSVFPFNFFTRYKRIPGSTAVVVFPKPIRCRTEIAGEAPVKSKGDRTSDAAGSDGELLAIRDYIIGDPPKYISWKSTAKTGVLKTRELSSIEDRQVIINLDRIARKDLERALSCSAYTILKLIREKIPVGLTVEGETVRPGLSIAHKIKLLTRLALYVPSERHP